MMRNRSIVTRRGAWALIAGLISVALVAPAAGARTGVAAPERRTAGDLWFELETREFRVAGSPYHWRLRVTRFQPKGGMPQEWNLTINASRGISHGGIDVTQLHEWNFTVPPDAVTVPQDLKGAHINADFGAFGSVDLRLRDVGDLKDERIRCPKTGAVLARVGTRGGTWTGDLTFNTQAVDPQMPATLQVDAVRGNASRERSTAADCDSSGGNRCRPSRFLYASEAVDATTSNSVNVQQHGKFRYLQLSNQTEVGDVRIGHAIVATGRFNPILMHPTSVTIGLEPLVPFVTGGPFVWTRGVPVVDQTAKCVRTQIPLDPSSGDADVDFDTGAVVISAPTPGNLYLEALP